MSWLFNFWNYSKNENTGSAVIEQLNKYFEEHQTKDRAERINPETAETKQEWCSIIQKYLVEIDETKGRDGKEKVCMRLMDYLVVNREYILNTVKFLDTVYDKFVELARDDDFWLSIQFWEIFHRDLHTIVKSSEKI